MSKFSILLSTPEKTKDNEHVESHGDGSIALLSTSSVFVDSEKYEVADVEQLKRKSPDEVCVAWYDVVRYKLKHDVPSIFSVSKM